MSITAEPFSRPRAAALSLRYALRELRGGLRGFYVFIACIALGVLAIAGVGSVSASLTEGLAREGRTLLGGDVSFVLFQREAKPDEVAFLRSRGRWRPIPQSSLPTSRPAISTRRRENRSSTCSSPSMPSAA